jgi:hypothetical protein
MILPEKQCGRAGRQKQKRRGQNNKRLFAYFARFAVLFGYFFHVNNFIIALTV